MRTSYVRGKFLQSALLPRHRGLVSEEPNISVARMLTRDLFAVDNLLTLRSCGYVLKEVGRVTTQSV